MARLWITAQFRLVPDLAPALSHKSAANPRPCPGFSTSGATGDPTCQNASMHLDVMPGTFAVCLLHEPPDTTASPNVAAPVFIAVTGSEICLVCPSRTIPQDAIAVEDDWAMLRVAGPLDFSLVGIIAQLTGVLARAGVPVFVTSTFLTDYLLIKANRLSEAIAALEADGHTVTQPPPAHP